MNLIERRIKDKACTICDGLQTWGKGVRAVSKERCDSCKDGSNWRLRSEEKREKDEH